MIKKGKGLVMCLMLFIVTMITDEFKEHRSEKHKYQRLNQADE
jgi:NADH:ubiquinone oxidoreductase subunit 6 (subunit J)